MPKSDGGFDYRNDGNRAFAEHGGNAPQFVSGFGLRQHQTEKGHPREGAQVVFEEIGLRAVDAYPRGAVSFLQPSAHRSARGAFVYHRNRILQVDDDRTRAAGRGFGEALRSIAGNEQVAVDHAAFALLSVQYVMASRTVNDGAARGVSGAFPSGR